MNRYSTIVSWMKVVLPILALALLSTLFLFSRTPDPDAALPFAEIDVDELIREQRLSQPRFASVLNDGREVTLVAETAAPSLTNRNRILMTVIDAQLQLSEDDVLQLTADLGDIDLAGRVVDMEGDVIANTVTGHRLVSDQIHFSMDEMRLVSPGPVELTGPEMRLEAGAMMITGPESAAFLHFTEGVRLIYGPEE